MSDSPMSGSPSLLQRSLPGGAYLTTEAFALDSEAIFARDVRRYVTERHARLAAGG
jgi:hypothetical protein